ncbi:NUDIX domain-containing protein [Streptomyces sp. NPDC007325]|uniref:NUDIX hydrolase n=1 Tax=Streptomyces sp. NPDC007325 TaxID=3154588 RepID=UPI0033F84803
MTEKSFAADLKLYDVEHLLLAETGEPPVSARDAEARDRVWEMAVRSNPALFDGPVVACGGVEWEGPRTLRLFWARVTYRHYALRRVPGAVALPSLFVNVLQPDTDGRVLAVRMSPSTAAPGRWQLPGGSVEPPEVGAVLDEATLAGQAARELVEELGVEAADEDLRLWAVTRGENGSIGLTYRAPARAEATLHAGLESARAADRARGREPELDAIALLADAAELSGLQGAHADYLEQVVRRFTAAG